MTIKDFVDKLWEEHGSTIQATTPETNITANLENTALYVGLQDDALTATQDQASLDDHYGTITYEASQHATGKTPLYTPDEPDLVAITYAGPSPNDTTHGWNHQRTPKPLITKNQLRGILKDHDPNEARSPTRIYATKPTTYQPQDPVVKEAQPPRTLSINNPAVSKAINHFQRAGHTWQNAAHTRQDDSPNPFNQ